MKIDLERLENVKKYLNAKNCRIPNYVKFDFWYVVYCIDNAAVKENAFLKIKEGLTELGLLNDLEETIKTLTTSIEKNADNIDTLQDCVKRITQGKSCTMF